MLTGLKVIAPASVSNLACGFDILGLALDHPGDEIVGRWTEQPGVHIAELSGFKKDIPLDPSQNIACVTANALLKHLGEEARGLELKIKKHIPAGSGLGSSASSACAAAVLVNELLGRPLERRELIPFALEGELIASGTPVGDNIVASMIGGLVFVRDIKTFDFHRIYMPPGLFVAVLLPDVPIHTKSARAQLKPEVPLSLMVQQTANLGAFVMGMQNSDLDLIRRSMKDLVIEPQRSHQVPHFYAVQQVAMELGALGCSISGAGPAIFALCQEKLQAENISAAMQQVYTHHQQEAMCFVAGINREGVIKK